MKGLTVHQPWAWAIFAPIPAGPKDVENRSQLWHHRGELAILGGRRPVDVVRRHRVQRLAGDLEVPADYALPMGFVLGVVDLVDVHWAEAGCCSSRWAEEQPYVSRLTERRVARVSHLVLARPRPVLQPIPATGFLGMRDLPAYLGPRIRERLAA